jgi:putative ABC transport system substrate-binding protein
MDRRAFLTTVGLGIAAAPLVGEAQQAGRVYRIGLVAVGPSPLLMNPFWAAMREYGWIEGQNFTLEPRYTAGKPEHDRVALATELIEQKVDLILAINSASAQAAKRASTAVPIVMLMSGFPVEAGLAVSLARPGGNVTGLSIYAGGGIFAKYVQFLKELLPRLTTFAVFWDYVPPGFVPQEVEASLGEMKRAARSAGVTAHIFEIATRGDLDRAMGRLSTEPVDALFVTHGPIQRDERTAAEVMAFALKRRIPTMTDLAGNVFAAGCLLTYSANITEVARRGAGFADRILRGARPADLPIELPAKFELHINLKTAKALGLAVPQSLLVRADQVIQ